MHIAQIYNTFLTTDTVLTMSLLKQFEQNLLFNVITFIILNACPLLALHFQALCEQTEKTSQVLLHIVMI